MSELFVRIVERNIPLDKGGCVMIDLFILMPASKRYVPFVKKGDKYTDDKKDKLKKHVLPDIFVLPSELNEAIKSAANRDKMDIPKEGEFNAAVLGKQAESELKKIYEDLLSDEIGDPQELVDELQKSSDKILALVAPESKELTKIFFNNAKYINLMNDASAIVSLAVMFAFANGFDSKKSYLELTQAALVMDVSLNSLTEDQRKLMYTDYNALPDEVKKVIDEHPKISFQLVSKKIPNLSEITLQLILNHHELFNGKGFPRGVRSESLFPLVKILALAVDVHDSLKRFEYENKKVDLTDIIFNIHNEEIDAHLRRHNRSVTQKVLNFFDTHEKDAA